eukprot:TRINITY_DN9981_c0_g1_i1.p1 TRINITY_DN9981_c0_g1~~TRINITY_DN9981_c0_g1_i1.p1  ORF type:complete len:419 (-),score=87.73 TRINITY_DN9981_c0_g1_i1:202-1458(-)
MAYQAAAAPAAAAPLSDLSAQFPSRSAADVLRATADYAEANQLDSLDVYGEGAAVQRLEQDVAAKLGKQRALWFPTGSSAQVCALRSHISLARCTGEYLPLPRCSGGDSKPSVALHPTSHILHHDCLRHGANQDDSCEAHRCQNLPEFNVVTFGKIARAASFVDVSKAIKSAEEDDKERIYVVVLELPQRMNGGAVISFSDLAMVRAICTAKKIALHMDGARLWEVQPYYDRPFSEICEFFDSVYVSFYKGMGGISGAMLLGKSDFIEVAREARDCLGAKMFCATPYTLHCHKQFTELVDTFGTRLQRLREMVKIIKEEVEAHAPGKVWFDPKEPQSCMIHVYLKLDQRAEKELEAAHQLVMNDHRVRLWNRMRGPGHSNPGEACYFEWSMGPANAAISDDLVRSAWQAFLQDFYKPQ